MENAIAAMVMGPIMAAIGAFVLWAWEQQEAGTDPVAEPVWRRWLPFGRVVRNLFIVVGLMMFFAGFAALVLDLSD